MKKRLIVLSAALLVALYALSAFAANVTGKWTAEDKDPDGDPSTITYVFKQEGTQLTGTVAIPAETANISNGKVDGDKVSFVAVFSFGTITHTGTVHAVGLSEKLWRAGEADMGSAGEQPMKE
jgi:hypothetical protein